MLEKEGKIKIYKNKNQNRKTQLRKPKTTDESKEIVIKSSIVKSKRIFNPPKPILIFDKNINHNPPKSSNIKKTYLNQKTETKKIPSNRVFGKLKLKLRSSTEGQNLPLISIKKSTCFQNNEQTKVENPNLYDNVKISRLRVIEPNVHNSLHKYFVEYSYKEDPNVNWRKSMEDFSDINADFYHDDKYDIAFFGLYDGFCGKEVALYLKQHLQKKLLKNLCKSNFNIEKSFGDTFNQIEKEIQLIKNSTTCGSTATIVLLLNNYLYCANVGNSTCYEFSQDKAIKISVDHDCKNENEIQRIKKSGGEVFNGRVFGSLSLTRCFGDLDFKSYGVIPIPTISKKKINHKDLFTVIASDGVWDVVTSSYLLEMVNTKELNATKLSDLIIQTSLNNYTKDNVSCIVIKY